MNDMMSHRRAVRAIVLNGDKLLSMHRNKFGKEYYTLVGGGVDLGEDEETALRREVREETGLELGDMRLVFIEDAGALFGPQYVFLCEYKGGNPVLSPNSEEAKINQGGQNLYEPLWLPLADVSKVPFRSSSVAEALLAGVANGWPEKPKHLDWRGEE